MFQCGGKCERAAATNLGRWRAHSSMTHETGPGSTTAADGTVRCAITIDLHEYNDPRDIGTASIWLAEQGIPATFFVPSLMFEDASMTDVLRALPELGHEVGSHAHYHNYLEVHTLISGDVDDLGFLSVSHDVYSRFYGTAPRAFRCPLWCYVGQPARREARSLGVPSRFELDPPTHLVLELSPV